MNETLNLRGPTLAACTAAVGLALTSCSDATGSISAEHGTAERELVTPAPVAGSPSIDPLLHTRSLKSVHIPDPPDLGRFVRDRGALLVLGKALFWDQQLGSDGQACASCHFKGGADNRRINQLNPGFRSGAGGGAIFGSGYGVLRNLTGGAGYHLTKDDFPFRVLANPDDRDSAVLRDVDDIASSLGVFPARFVGLVPGSADELATPILFSMGGRDQFLSHDGRRMFRAVEPRNTPTAINAALNHRNFWDGRARSEFNGVDPFGELVETSVHRADRSGGSVVLEREELELEHASHASQAVGPPLSNLEMSFEGRSFFDVGKKMVAARPLALQRVAADDGVLGAYRHASGLGLVPGYAELIRSAFHDEWWDGANADGSFVVARVISGPGGPSLQLVTVPAGTALGANEHTLAELNFSLFFGLAVREYENTLISDDTPFDRYLEALELARDGSVPSNYRPDIRALTPKQLRGLQIFLNEGKCINCHGGAELTNASRTNARNQLIERMVMGDGRVAAYDNGFYNIGVRPTAEDIGLGDTAPSGQPLSEVRRHQQDPSRAPRIRALPEDALLLLDRLSERLARPADLEALLGEAEASLHTDVVAAFALLEAARAWIAAQPLTPDLVALLDDVALLLPDPNDPGPDPEHPFAPPLRADERVAVDGAFKTPGLRNVELTAPYFHNGGQGTLRHVVEFYNRGADFSRHNRDDLDPDIQFLGLTEQDKQALEAFLRALTDERVRLHQAPFDTPELIVPIGDAIAFTTDATRAVTVTHRLSQRVTVPATGRHGFTAAGGHAAGPPVVLNRFLETRP